MYFAIDTPNFDERNMEQGPAMKTSGVLCSTPVRYVMDEAHHCADAAR